LTDEIGELARTQRLLEVFLLGLDDRGEELGRHLLRRF
jgi:hypothetical protein